MCNWKSIILKSNDTLYDAINILNKEALKIVLIVDDLNRLIGTITDGDVRRALVKKHEMDTLLDHVMRKKPITVSKKQNKESMHAIMKSNEIFHLPIVNPIGEVVGLETLFDSTIKPKYDNAVFLMAGGFGKRLRPLTYKTPKPLLKIGDKPIIEIIFEQFIDAGFHNFYISVHYKAEMIRDYFSNGEKLGVNIKYVHEKEPLGTAGALSLLPDNMNDLPLIVMNGDLLTKVNFEHLLKYHHEQNGVATICTREYKVEVPYGVIKSDTDHVSDIVEKPIHYFHVNAGIYILDQKIVQSMSSVEFKDMPDLLQDQIDKGRKIYSYPLYEYWIDIGHIDEYNRAQSEIKNLFK
jgi:dTDP-glucose pyrophosphorylase